MGTNERIREEIEIQLDLLMEMVKEEIYRKFRSIERNVCERLYAIFLD